MKTRLPWIASGATLLLLLGVAAFFIANGSRNPTRKEKPGSDRASAPAELRRKFPPPAANAVAMTPPVPTLPVVRTPPPVFARPDVNTIDLATIRDRSTIDLSSGRPVITRGGADDEILDRALQEMAEAIKDVTFSAPEKSRAANEAKK